MRKQPTFDISTAEGREQWAADVLKFCVSLRQNGRSLADDDDGPRTMEEARALCAKVLAEREANPERAKIHGPDDSFGLCPHCHRPGNILNISRDNWIVCHAHRVRWYIGNNLLSGWRNEDEAVWRANIDLIGDYEIVRPFFWIEERSELP